MRCRAWNSKGDRCGKSALQGRGYCATHIPEQRKSSKWVAVKSYEVEPTSPTIGVSTQEQSSSVPTISTPHDTKLVAGPATKLESPIVARDSGQPRIGLIESIARLFKPDTLTKVDRLAKDALPFVALIRLAADRQHLGSWTLLNEIYAFPISHINQVMLENAGDQPHVREIRHGLQLCLGYACYAKNHSAGMTDPKTPEVQSFVKRFRELSEQQCISHSTLLVLGDAVRRTAGRDEQILRVSYGSLRRFFSASVSDSEISQLIEWFYSAWDGFDTLTRPYIIRHCVRA